MAKPDANLTSEPVIEEVEMYIPRESGSDPYMFVGLNGVRYLFPRGKASKMPAPVAEIVKRALEARNRADEYAEELSKTDGTALAYM